MRLEATIFSILCARNYEDRLKLLQVIGENPADTFLDTHGRNKTIIIISLYIIIYVYTKERGLICCASQCAKNNHVHFLDEAATYVHVSLTLFVIV